MTKVRPTKIDQFDVWEVFGTEIEGFVSWLQTDTPQSSVALIVMSCPTIDIDSVLFSQILSNALNAQAITTLTTSAFTTKINQLLAPPTFG